MKTFYHGGQPGRTKGAFILPPTITNQKSCSDFGADGVHWRDKVYLTTSIQAALLFASGCKNGVIYECDAVGMLDDDPDCAITGLSYQCDKARVIRVIKLSKKHIEAARITLMTE